MALGDEAEKKSVQVHMMMAPSEVEAIDNWSFANRVRGRTEAVRRLCQLGIAFDAEAPTLLAKAKELELSLDRMDAALASDESDGSRESRNYSDAVGASLDAAVELASSLIVIHAMRDYVASSQPKAAERAQQVRAKFRDLIARLDQGEAVSVDDEDPA